MPIQQLFLGAGGPKQKTYMEDVFSTYVYKGNESARAINNGIDLGKGGLVWVKSRNDTHDHQLVDTARGANDIIKSNTTDAEATVSNRITGFNGNGFNLGSAGQVNGTSAYDYSSWTFRKAKGFFDVVTWTGNGVDGRQIPHGLSAIPGFIMVKRTSSSEDWACYHKELPINYGVALNKTDGASTVDWWDNTRPTSTAFTVSNSGRLNENNATYVGYVFAGGEDQATSTARSVDFDGGGDYLTIANHSDFDFGTGAYTIEFWMRTTSDDGCIFFNSASTGNWYGMRLCVSGGNIEFNEQVNDQDHVVSGGKVSDGTWHHIAVCRGASGDSSKIYVDGTLKGTGQANRNFDNNNTVHIGSREGGGAEYNGELSNLRVVKGSAVYTSSFRPSTVPLTNITNTVLLCCNNSSTSGSSVTPGTITANGNPTASTDSPFDDPAGFVFGENADQSVIATGSYYGNGSTNGPEIFLGWEPQFLIIKGNTDWHMVDNMRGIVTNGTEPRLFPNGSGGEAAQDIIDLTPTGFKVTAASAWVNADNVRLIYIAIRRPDGYCGKPIEDATKYFAMDTGSGSSAGPEYDSGFPVDLAIHRTIASNSDWWTSARLMQGKHLETNNTLVESSSDAADYVFDYNDGWYKNGYGSGVQSWMWKRHAGLDVMTYKGDGASSRTFAHSLGRTPEMMWLRGRGPNQANWYVYHKDLDTPNRRVLHLETNDAQSSATSGRFNDTSPTATHFTIGINSNNNNDKHIVMLFAGIDNFSKISKYTGTGSSGLSVTTGFQPRFLIIKRIDTGGTNWLVFDNLRGFGSGNDSKLSFNLQAAAVTNTNFGAFTSTGFTINETYSEINNSGGTYVYYCHA